VPKDAHRDPRVNVESRQKRRAGVPGVVDPDTWNARLPAVRIKGPVEVARFDRCAVAGREDEVGFMPLVSRLVAGIVLNPLTVSERRDAESQQGKGGRRVVCFGGFPMKQLPADPGELTGDPEFFADEVYAVPRQPKHLTAPQAEHEDQHISRIERIIFRSQVLKQPASLVDTPHSVLPLVRLAARGRPRDTQVRRLAREPEALPRLGQAAAEGDLAPARMDGECHQRIDQAQPERALVPAAPGPEPGHRGGQDSERDQQRVRHCAPPPWRWQE
jgi:hypothetical protein